jgi:hypothetical protein
VRVLLDESVPRPWKRDIPDHDVVHVADLEWQGLKNGELLRRAGAAGFNALVTTDRNIEHQQNLARVELGIVIVRTRRNRIQELRPLTPALLEALVRWWLDRSSREVARKTLNLSEFATTRVAVPPIAEQTEIIRRTAQLLAYAARLERRISPAQSLLSSATPSALSKAFRGEFVPQDPNDEPASELLARLRAGPIPRATPASGQNLIRRDSDFALASHCTDDFPNIPPPT